MQQILYPANERGLKDIGWLQSRFSFSFSSYQHPGKKSFGLLHTLNDDIVQPGGGFGLHPHVNMEIISVLLQGTMNHKDSMGYSDVVTEDWVQIMSAGTGLRHEEFNVGNNDVQFLQIWIEPKLQNITPRYQKRHFPKSKRANQLVTIVSNAEGTDHCWINQNAHLRLGYYTAAATIHYPIPTNNTCVYIMNINGLLSVGDTLLQTKDAIGVWQTNEIVLNIEPNTSFIVIEVPINH